MEIEVTFKQKQALPNSIIKQICKSISEGFVSGEMNDTDTGLGIHWSIYIELTHNELKAE